MSRISVIIPMKNCEQFVRPALESVLSQDGVDLDVVVVDDGSTDRSAEVVRSMNDPRVRLITGPEQGIAAALNAGLAAAKGDYFARCDADDLFAPGRLSRQKAWLEANADYGAICGRFTHVNRSGKPLHESQRWSPTAEEVTHELRNGSGRTHLGTYLIRMAPVRQLEGFRPYFVGTEDADFQLRLGEVCRVWYEPVPCYIYRLHDSSITHTQPSAERTFLEEMARKFQQQRLATGSDDLQRGCAPPVPENLKSTARGTGQQIQAILLGEAWRFHRAGRKSEAVATGLRACLAAPAHLPGWRSLAALLWKRARPDGSNGREEGT